MRRVCWFLLAVALSGTLLSGQERTGITGREIAQRIFPSVALLICEDSHAQPVSLGSGFVVADETVATNLHVIEGAAGGFLKLVGVPKKYTIRGTVGVDRGHDLALLSVPGMHAPIVPLGSSQQASVGDEVYAIGNPEGLEGTISQGIVSGIRGTGSDTLLQITAPISPGSSGGPVVNLRGEVIGLAVATLKIGQNLNFAVPSMYLSQLLGRRTEALPFPTREHIQRKTRQESSVGDPAVSGVSGLGFLWSEDGCLLPPEHKCGFSFTLRNNMQSPVDSVKYILIFHDSAGTPIDAYEHETYDEIRPGLAARVAIDELETTARDASVRRLTRRVEIRILDFTLNK